MRPTRTVLLSVAVIAAVLALAGCAAEAPSPTAASTSTPTTTPTATAAASPSQSPPSQSASPSTVPVNIPGSCDDLSATYGGQTDLYDMTLIGDASGLDLPAPDGATTALGCDWSNGDDITGVRVVISTADVSAVDAALDALPAEGYTCGVADDFGAVDCERPYGSVPDTVQIVLARDSTWLYMDSSNRNVNAFVSATASDLFNG